MSRRTQQSLRLAETIVVAGGSGYVGRALVRKLLSHGHSVMIATRNPGRTLRHPDFPIPPRLAVFDIEQTPPHDPTVVINLCGENIAAKRWTAKRKEALLQSRVKPTQLLVRQCNDDWEKVHTFINASAIGFYGDHANRWIDEDSNGGDDFAAQLCQQWELGSDQLRPEIRKVITRLGVVIGEPRNGSFVGKLLPSYKFCASPQLGDGQHWFSWIHRADAARAICFLVENHQHSGTFNLTAPQPERYERLHKIFSKTVERPNLARLPAFAIRALFGEMAELLLCSQKVRPKRLVEAGFTFDYDNLQGALHQALTGKNLATSLRLPKLTPESEPTTKAQHHQA